MRGGGVEGQQQLATSEQAAHAHAPVASVAAPHRPISPKPNQKPPPYLVVGPKAVRVDQNAPETDEPHRLASYMRMATCAARANFSSGSYGVFHTIQGEPYVCRDGKIVQHMHAWPL